MTQSKDVEQRQRLQALYLVVSGHAQRCQTLAAQLGVYRYTVTAWLNAYAEGDLSTMLSYQVPWPPHRSRITSTTFTALQTRLQEPHGFAGYALLRPWWAEPHQVSLSSSGVYTVERGKLRAKPQRL